MSYQPIFINPPFLQCHGSTIAELHSGDFIVAWFAGTREASPDTAIWVCRQKDGEWLSPHVAVKCGDVAHWNPVLFMITFIIGSLTYQWYEGLSLKKILLKGR